MSTKQIITVMGATGRQGGGLVDFLLQDGTFAARAVTRNKNSDAAKSGYFLPVVVFDPCSIVPPFAELADRGVEVVVADLDDPESLRIAFKDSYGVFGVTDCEVSSFVL